MLLCLPYQPTQKTENRIFSLSRVVVVVVGKRNFSRALQQKQQQQKMRNEFFCCCLLLVSLFPFPFSLFLWFSWLFLGFGWVFLGYGWLFLGFLKRCKALIFKPFKMAFLRFYLPRAFFFLRVRQTQHRAFAVQLLLC